MAGAMLIRYGYDLEFFCPQPVVMLTLLDAHPEVSHRIATLGTLETNPPIETATYSDAFGNEVRRFLAPAGMLRISRDCVYECDGAPQETAPHAKEVPLTDLPSENFVYLLGSRYCETDKLSSVAWSLFGHTEPGWSRVQAICDFVEQHMTFGYEFARATRTAAEAFEERVGVCRDFAHLAVTLCRCMNIPTRYANGFMGNIGRPADPLHEDYNAWFEVYLDHEWYIFDARHNVPRVGRITVARGRDAADIPLTVSFGPHDLTAFRVWTDEIAEAVAPELESAG
jgi:transglutaminase-like putative cysteine protease